MPTGDDTTAIIGRVAVIAEVADGGGRAFAAVSEASTVSRGDRAWPVSPRRAGAREGSGASGRQRWVRDCG
ncbi:hypothetical protein H4W34_007492 [Actinomadura algeriensis]|uniref:Uncharacterized protein n=1 Tax=Actinomadura algeriensis TaxID=1679523 RepID=A0ABR9K4U9_9ACTN|nr:hypothetical protein [Actinomadura algeriensis]